MRRPTERSVLMTAALATMLIPLNSTMVAVALPAIVDDLGASVAASAWLVSGYLIAQASLGPLSGRLGDRLGRRPLILSVWHRSGWCRWVRRSLRAWWS